MAFEYVPYNGPIVTRAEARSLGLGYFFTSKPCRKGHLAQRTTEKSHCLACIGARKEKKRIYACERRAADPERARAYLASWRADNSDKNKEYDKRQREKRAEKRKEEYDIWAECNPDYRILYYLENKERIKVTNRNWRVANPEKSRAIVHRRRARLKGAGGCYTKDDVDWLIVVQKGRCAHPWCRVKLNACYHVDHIVPISKGGTNDRRNLQLLCAFCNHSKNAKHPIDHALKNGHLV